MTTRKIHRLPQYLIDAGFEIGKYGGGVTVNRRSRKSRQAVVAQVEIKPVEAKTEYPSGPQDVTEILRVTVTA